MGITVRKRKILIWIAAIVAAYTVIGFLILPYALKSILLKRLPALLHRDVSIASITFNPYNLRMRIKGFVVKKLSGEGDLFSFEELYINVESPTIIMRGPIVKEIKLTNPHIGVVRNEDGSYSVSDLVGEALAVMGSRAEKTDEAAPEGRPLAFSINNIQIYGGSVDFEDIPKKKVHEVRDLTLTIPFVSNRPKYLDAFVLPAFSATVNGTKFDLKGNTKPFTDTLETSLDVRLAGLDLAYYAAYSPVPLGFSIASAMMDIDTTLSYIQHTDSQSEVTLAGLIALKDVKFKDRNSADMFGFDSFAMGISRAELFTKKIDLSAVTVDRPYLNAVRGKDGRLNLAGLVPAASPRKGASGAGKPAAAGGGLTLEIDDIAVRSASLNFTDLSTATPFKKAVTPVDVSIKGFSAVRAKDALLSLSYKAASGEALAAEGPVSINPVKADLKVSAAKVDVAPVRSYLDEMLRIIITRGKASTSGRLKLAVLDGGKLTGSYSGDFRVSKFSSISKAGKEDFLKWDTLAINGIDASYNPNQLLIDGVALSGFYSRLIINPDGVLNVQQVIVKKEEPEGKAEAPVEAAKAEGKTFFKEISIDTVTLQGGHVNFTDKHIKPSITIDLLELGGRVSGLKSIEDSYADVNLLGKFGKYAPLEIKGRVNPLAGNLFVDLKLDFKDFDLSSLSPYSGKYVGYEIAKGKLILDLDYHIENRKLDSTNSVVLDQITFGKKVDSPTATKLPVRFALNLLKNRKGEVELDIPVSGSLDDPEFRIGGVIFRLVVNFIVKAVTSPFALLGAIIGGGGDDMSYAEFDPGSLTLTDRSMSKLDDLVAALFERPGLTLEIKGYVDRTVDTLALRDVKYIRAIKAEKLSGMIKTGKEVPELDDVVIEPDEYEKYLWAAYKKTDFPKPENFLGMTKRLPPEELEKLMLANIVVTEDDLYDLAQRRAGAVRDYILATGKVEPERLYMVRPDTLEPEERPGVMPSRVEFTLQ